MHYRSRCASGSSGSEITRLRRLARAARLSSGGPWQTARGRLRIYAGTADRRACFPRQGLSVTV
jgi:hypothetical protein